MIFLKSPGFIKLDKKCNIPSQSDAGLSYLHLFNMLN